ncbi:MAG: MFS transporter [Chloroflexales bacterium]|nr:MFS transporter [Chloroflexales bacterium]
MLTDSAQSATPSAEGAVMTPQRLWNRNFLLLWQGQFVSRLGNQVFEIALVLWLKQVTGAATLMGLILMVSSIPALILTPIGGAFADRYSRKKIIVVCDLLSGIVMLSLAALFFFTPDSTQVLIVGVFVVAVVMALLRSFFGPAIGAAIPDMVPPGRIAAANAMGQLSMQVSRFFGQGLGGVLFRVLGAPLMFLIDGLTFLFSAVSEALITIPQRMPERSSRWQDRFAEFRRDLVEGQRYIWRNAGLKWLVLISAMGNFFTAPILLLFPFYVEDYLGATSDWYGFILAAFGVGSLLGFLAVSVMPPSGRLRARMMLLVLFFDAALYGLLVLAQHPWQALAMAILAGATGGFLTVNITALIQMTTPSEIRGRVFGVLTTISGSITPLAMGLSGIIADMTGRNIPLIYLVCSAVLLSLALLITLNRGIRAFLAYEPAATAAANSPSGSPN